MLNMERKKMIINQLVLRNKNQELIYRGIGVFWFIGAITSSFSSDRKSCPDFFIHILFSISGIVYVTNYLGTLINRLTMQDNILIIRWYSKIRKKRVSIDEIFEITGINDFIRIILK